MNWFRDNSKEAIAERLRRQEIAHAERIKVIESGQPLPEIVTLRTEAERVRYNAIATGLVVRALLMVLGPAAICGIATGGTNVVLVSASPALHSYFVSLIWAAAVVISVTVVAGIAMIGRQIRWPEEKPVAPSFKASSSRWEDSDSTWSQCAAKDEL